MKLSIITINLNNSQGLLRTISSVVSQTYNGFEFIIIDGGSTDESLQIIKANSNKINFWISEKDNGIYNAMNKGILKAIGEYILFLNSGDCLANESILGRVFVNTNYDADILYGNLRVFKNNIFVGKATTPSQITLRTLYEGTIHHQAAFIRKNLFAKFGPYNEEYKIRADWEFWIRTIIINNCSSFCLNMDISNYDGDGISSNSNQSERIESETNIILNSYFPIKVLEDYKTYIEYKKDMKIFEWVKRKKTLVIFINSLYNLVSLIYKIKIGTK